MDKVILITGASSGIGAALARELGATGARFLLGARRRDRIEAPESVDTSEITIRPTASAN